MREQFEPPCIVKLKFPFELDQVSRWRYLLEMRHRSLKEFRLCIPIHGVHVTEKLASTAVKIGTKDS